MEHKQIAQAVASLYASLKFIPPPRQFTVLASFVLYDRQQNIFKIISLATGSKCLPASRLPPKGDALHDSHAEVLARRGAIRWILEEICRKSSSMDDSSWVRHCSDGFFALKDHIDIILYVSTVPCKSYTPPSFPNTPLTRARRW